MTTIPCQGVLNCVSISVKLSRVRRVVYALIDMGQAVKKQEQRGAPRCQFDTLSDASIARRWQFIEHQLLHCCLSKILGRSRIHLTRVSELSALSADTSSD